MTFFLEGDPGHRRAIGRVLAAGDVELVAGGPRQEEAGENPVFYNTIFSISPTGDIQDRYDKELLVPFAEYFPNDIWIPEPRFTAQQFDIIALRAVEQRRFLVRASTSGPSAIVDPWGRVVARTEAGTRGLVSGRVSPREDLTLYARLGDLFAFLSAGAVALALLLGVRSATR
jgi:apolipoprotein N-acyltransferase